MTTTKKQNHNSKLFFQMFVFSFGNPNTQVTARYTELLGVDLSRWTRFQSGEINSMIVELFRSGNVYLPKIEKFEKEIDKQKFDRINYFRVMSVSLSLTHTQYSMNGGMKECHCCNTKTKQSSNLLNNQINMDQKTT